MSQLKQALRQVALISPGSRQRIIAVLERHAECACSDYMIAQEIVEDEFLGERLAGRKYSPKPGDSGKYGPPYNTVTDGNWVPKNNKGKCYYQTGKEEDRCYVTTKGGPGGQKKPNTGKANNRSTYNKKYYKSRWPDGHQKRASHTNMETRESKNASSDIISRHFGKAVLELESILGLVKYRLRDKNPEHNYAPADHRVMEKAYRDLEDLIEEVRKRWRSFGRIDHGYRAASVPDKAELLNRMAAVQEEIRSLKSKRVASKLTRQMFDRAKPGSHIWVGVGHGYQDADENGIIEFEVGRLLDQLRGAVDQKKLLSPVINGEVDRSARRLDWNLNLVDEEVTLSFGHKVIRDVKSFSFTNPR